MTTTTTTALTLAPHILVAYASACGSTREVAEAVVQTLRETVPDATVDLLAAKDVHDLAGYDAVVLGSAIRAGHVLPEALTFAQHHRDTLVDVPVAYFVGCATMKDDTPANEATVHGYLAPLRAIKEPVAEGLFAGRIDPAALNPFLRLMLKAMKSPSGDWRDWERIHEWATSVAPTLAASASTSAPTPTPVPVPELVHA